MRILEVSEITKSVKKLCMEANYYLPQDVEDRIRSFKQRESSPRAVNILGQILENISIAREMEVPLCQDTGLTCVFVEVGQEVQLVGGLLADAINEGVRQGYDEGYLRKSIVADPLHRVNTNTNTPAVITTDLVLGDQVKILVAPKGFGSENMSRIKMCTPAEGVEGVKAFVVETVELAQSNPCPPIVVGVGIGATFDRVALLAKRALLRPLDVGHPDPFYLALEEELLTSINALGIGVQGFGGDTTALKVQIEHAPTHIAGMPVAVNINCHVARHKQIVL
ncbi:MAG: fumarate hydratase [Eubacteriales bacterium]